MNRGMQRVTLTDVCTVWCSHCLGTICLALVSSFMASLVSSLSFAWAVFLFLISSHELVYISIKGELIYTEDNEYWSSNIAPKHQQQWIELEKISCKNIWWSNWNQLQAVHCEPCPQLRRIGLIYRCMDSAFSTAAWIQTSLQTFQWKKIKT